MPLTLDLVALDTARATGLDDLLALDFDELEGHQDVSPLDVNWPAYYGLERAGVLKILALRRAGALIGYNIFFLQPPLHSRRTLWAVNDVLYLTPEERRGWTGVFLVRRSEQMLREMGARVIMYASKPDLSSKRHRDSVGRLFARLGYGVFDHTWTKAL